MSTWIKICGLADAAAVEAVVQANVQAAGFVFAESVRRVTPGQASELARQLPADMAKVAVFLRPTQQEIDAVLLDFYPDYVQADWSALASLDLPESVMSLPVIREGQPIDPADLPPRFVYEGAQSGVGHRVDWHRANDLGQHHELILAGGLSPVNVKAAIMQAQPFGVDVSSGVESAPGQKDPELIMEFVHQVRDVSVRNNSVATPFNQ